MKRKISEKSTRDNLHWWGGYKKSHIPSAPGAFHAFHLHWRWGKNLQDTNIPLILPSGGEPQFKGNFIGGPLVDPKISKQFLEVVITKKQRIDTLLNSNTFDLEGKLRKISKYPENIKNGDNLSALISIKVLRSTFISDLRGTIFIHGFYFGHEKEPASIKSGLRSEEYTPRKPNSDPPDWRRNPNDL